MLPLHLIVLDAIGCIMIGLGLAKQFGGIDLLPAQFQLENYGLIFIIFGVILMAPAVFHFVKRVRSSLPKTEKS